MPSHKNMKTKLYLLLVFTVHWSLFIHHCSAQDLSDYQQIAAEQNPGLQAKYKAYESQIQEITVQEGLSDPTFSFGYFIAPVETRVGPQRARFNLTQMFPWFGTLKARGHVKTLEAEAQFQSFLAAKAQLFHQVSQAYYPLFELEEWMQAEKENQRILQSVLRLTQQQFENGKSPMVDVLRVEMYLEQSRTQLTLLEKKRSPLLAQFNALLNRPAQSDVSFANAPTFHEDDTLLSADSLWQNHPEGLALQGQTDAALARTELLKKEQMPRLGVGMDYVVVGSARTAGADGGKDAWMPMVSLSLPIFGKKNRAATKAAELMVESNALKEKALALEFSSQYDRILYRLMEQKSLFELYNNQLQTIAQSLRLLLAAYENTEASIEDILSLQQQGLTYQKEKASAMMNYQIAWSELNYYTSKYE